MAADHPHRSDQEQRNPEQRADDRRAAVDIALVSGLSGYIRAVAGALDVTIEATDFEVSDTATAYLGLAVQSAHHPHHDLMLVWNEWHGWALAAETTPAEQPAVLAYLGADLVPEPATVARFVRDAIGDFPEGERMPPSIAVDRHDVGARLARYAARRR
jgi:hypothetical protein